MKHVFLDTNVVLDRVLQREPWASAAEPLWEAISNRQLHASMSGVTPLNVAYITGRVLSAASLHTILSDLITLVEVSPVNAVILRAALLSPLLDYEDTVQHEGALTVGAEAIITRDPRDFRRAALPVFDPAAFIAQHLTSTE